MGVCREGEPRARLQARLGMRGTSFRALLPRGAALDCQRLGFDVLVHHGAHSLGGLARIARCLPTACFRRRFQPTALAQRGDGEVGIRRPGAHQLGLGELQAQVGILCLDERHPLLQRGHLLDDRPQCRRPLLRSGSGAGQGEGDDHPHWRIVSRNLSVGNSYPSKRSFVQTDRQTEKTRGLTFLSRSIGMRENQVLAHAWRGP